MADNYKIYRKFTFISIVLMILILFLIAFLAARTSTEEILFGNSYPVVQVFSGRSNTIISVSGKIINIVPEKTEKLLNIIKLTVFAPIGNFVEFFEKLLSLIKGNL